MLYEVITGRSDEFGGVGPGGLRSGEVRCVEIHLNHVVVEIHEKLGPGRCGRPIAVTHLLLQEPELLQGRLGPSLTDCGP